MTCHFGYTPQHTAFAALNLCVFLWFLRASRRIPTFVRCAICTGTIIGILYHTLMGVMCASESVSEAVHAHLDTQYLSSGYTQPGPRAKLRLAHLAAFLIHICLVRAHAAIHTCARVCTCD